MERIWVVTSSPSPPLFFPSSSSLTPPPPSVTPFSDTPTPSHTPLLCYTSTSFSHTYTFLFSLLFPPRYHRVHSPAGVWLAGRQEPVPQVPLPQGLPYPLRGGEPVLAPGRLLHPAHGLRGLLRHLLRRLHGAAAARPGRAPCPCVCVCVCVLLLSHQKSILKTAECVVLIHLLSVGGPDTKPRKWPWATFTHGHTLQRLKRL